MSEEFASFGAGCFWGVQKHFSNLEGIIDTIVGYQGGEFINPTYKDVCKGKTGHAEVCQIKFDKNIISYPKLMDLFWEIHNPTTLNAQGADIGHQYRSIIFYYNQEQKKLAIASKKKLSDTKIYNNPIITEIIEASKFWPAEEYHQHYLKKQGGRCPI